PISFDVSSVTNALSALLAEPTLGRLFVIEEAGTYAGYLALTFGFSIEYGGRDAFIDEIFLVDSARGRGLGTRAITEAMALCPSFGVRVLHLEVDLENTAAERLYRRLGFESHNRRLMHRHV